MFSLNKNWWRLPSWPTLWHTWETLSSNNKVEHEILNSAHGSSSWNPLNKESSQTKGHNKIKNIHISSYLLLSAFSLSFSFISLSFVSFSFASFLSSSIFFLNLTWFSLVSIGESGASLILCPSCTKEILLAFPWCFTFLSICHASPNKMWHASMGATSHNTTSL